MKRFFLCSLSALLSISLYFVGNLNAAEIPSGTERRILVLPFQINANESAANLRQELPALIRQSLQTAGFTVVSQAETTRLLRANATTGLNIAVARTLAQQAGVDYALYGSFSQTGDAFSIDTRLVNAAGTAPARPYFIEQDALIMLLPAVNTLVERINTDAIHKNAISDITIRGLQILDEDVVLIRLNMRKGDTITPLAINEEIKRIWDLGYFSDVKASVEQSGEGTILVFTVVEKPRIADVTINGSDEVDIDDILVVMSSKTGSVINERLLAQDIQKITELYRKEGYYLADVKYRIEERTDKASAVLVFDVIEGNKLYIKRIVLDGLVGLDADDIKEYMSLGERTFFSFFTGSGVLQEEHLERDTSAIAAFGMEQGYVDIKVAVPEITYDPDGIIVTFRVEEGPRYKLGTVGFKGDLLDTNERMKALIKLDEHKETSGYFSLTVLQEDTKAITDHYTDYGYAFAKVTLDTPKNPDEQTMDVYYTVEKNQRVHIRRLITEGNLRTRDNVILREMRLVDGDLFDGSKLRRSNERLNRLGYFKQVDTTIVPTDNPAEVDLKVSVQEDRTGSFTAGVGYSTDYQFGVSGSIAERNLFGRGYRLALSGFTSGDGTSFDLGFVNPRLNNSNLGFANNVYISEEEWDDFDKKTVGNTFRFFYPLGEYTFAGFGYRLDKYRLDNIPASAPRAYTEYEGDNISSVIQASVTFDSTNSTEHPTQGHIFRVFLEYGGGGLGGNDNFFKPVLEYATYYAPFTNKNHVLHVRGTLGGVFENSNKPVPVFDRFFIGGMDSVRGYDDDDLAPRDPVFNDELGGDRVGYVNLEYIWLFEKELGLAVVPFFDIAFQTDSQQTSDPFSELKKSVGLELRWRSPLGNLRLAYGYPLDDNVFGEKADGRFDFTMGNFF